MPTQTDFVVAAATAAFFCLASVCLLWGRLRAVQRAERAEVELSFLRGNIHRAGVRALARRAARAGVGGAGVGGADPAVPPPAPSLRLFAPPRAERDTPAGSD